MQDIFHILVNLIVYERVNNEKLSPEEFRQLQTVGFVSNSIKKSNDSTFVILFVQTIKIECSLR